MPIVSNTTLTVSQITVSDHDTNIQTDSAIDFLNASLIPKVP